MEQADNLSVIPLTTGWSDLGGWDAVWRETQQDGTRRCDIWARLRQLTAITRCCAQRIARLKLLELV